MKRSLHILCLMLTAGVPLNASAKATAVDQNPEFTACLTRLQQQAIDQGFEPTLVDEVFAGIELKPGVITSDRSQPEFVQTFTEYYASHVTPWRIARGRELLEEHAALLQDIQQQTGVPPQYIVAFWGLETNFGNYLGGEHTPSALATLACDARRGAYFTREFMAALSIIANGDIPADQFNGSWAGAFGHMQFMPSTFVAHAVDADGDGRRDVLTSTRDALFSGAHYLQSMGWQPGYRWGREVLLPEGFDYSTVSSAQTRPLSEWGVMGVTNTAGHPLPQLELASAILVPMGHRGPAFLVYDNFKIIKNWNRSQSYALAVGRLADRVSGAGTLHRALPKVRFSTQDIKQLQSGLQQLGFDAGKPDGIIGPATRDAIRDYQLKTGLIADGFPSEELFAQIRDRG